MQNEMKMKWNEVQRNAKRTERNDPINAKCENERKINVVQWHKWTGQNEMQNENETNNCKMNENNNPEMWREMMKCTNQNPKWM